MKRTIEKLTWHTCIILSVCWTVSAGLKDDSCRRPEITSNSSFYVYQRAGTFNTVVYHCLYLEEIECDRDICCSFPGNLHRDPVIKRSTYRYSDITKKCLDASIGKKQFKDKYGHSHNTMPVNSIFTCGNKAELNRTISVKLTHFNAAVDTRQDKILLKSGTICKYSSGFCNDEIEDIDVMWQVKDPAYLEWKRLCVSDLYVLILNKKSYGIIESHGKYYILELKDQSQDTWGTQYEDLTISTTIIEHANTECLEMVDHLELSFGNKQDMYDFITEKCIAEFYNVNSMLFDRWFLTALKLRRQESRLEELDVGYQRFKFQLTIYFCVVNFVVCLAIILAYYICKKYFIVSMKNIPDRSKPIADKGEYSYITSEYDTNSIYVLCERVK